MIFITQTGFEINPGDLQTTFRQFNVSRVLILRIVNDSDPHFSLPEEEFEKILKKTKNIEKLTKKEKKDYEDSLKANRVLNQVIRLLEESNIEYEYMEIKKSVTPFEIIAFLVKKCASLEEKIVLDITRGERTLIPILIQLASFLEFKIEKAFTLDFRTGKQSSFEIFPYSIDPDMRGKITKKVILSQFINETVKNYSEIAESKELTSKQINKFVNEFISPNGTIGFSHIKSRLNSLSNPDQGPKLLHSEINRKDNRIFDYKISDYGLMILFNWYYSVKYLIEKKKYENLVKTPWFSEISNRIDKIKFQGIQEVKSYFLK